MNVLPAAPDSSAADLHHCQREASKRPTSLTRNQIRSAILLNEDCDLWVVEWTDESGYYFLVGLGPTDLNDLRRIGVAVGDPEDLLSKHYFSLKQVVEHYYGQWIQIPAKGLTFAHMIDRTFNESGIVITTQIPELTNPWFKVDQEESMRLMRMSAAICQAVGLSQTLIR